MGVTRGGGHRPCNDDAGPTARPVATSILLLWLCHLQHILWAFLTMFFDLDEYYI